MFCFIEQLYYFEYFYKYTSKAPIFLCKIDRAVKEICFIVSAEKNVLSGKLHEQRSNFDSFLRSSNFIFTLHRLSLQCTMQL